jgi:hypothetical protein
MSGQPTFKECAAALLELVRDDAQATEFVAQFEAGLPGSWPGVTDALARRQLRMVRVAWSQRYLEVMAPEEEAVAVLVPGIRTIGR